MQQLLGLWHYFPTQVTAFSLALIPVVALILVMIVADVQKVRRSASALFRANGRRTPVTIDRDHHKLSDSR